MLNANKLKCLHWNLLTLLLMLLNIDNGCIGLTDVKVLIPAAVELGDRAILECRFDTEGEQLYSVKWYRNGREFFRYAPNDVPSTKYFPILGLHTNHVEANSTHVLIDNVTTSTGGNFGCEVTMDAPSFYTGIDQAILEVVVLPQHDPYISGLKSRYNLNETLTANCTSNDSMPAAKLRWYVNGQVVTSSDADIQRMQQSRHGNLYRANRTLRLPLTEELFAGRRLKIRCVATIHSIYYRSTEKSVELERPKPRYDYTMPTVTTLRELLLVPADSEVIQRPSTSGCSKARVHFKAFIVISAIAIATRR